MDSWTQPMINSLHELKRWYALILSNIAIKPTYTWPSSTRKTGGINVLPHWGFIMESLGEERRIYGDVCTTHKGEKNWFSLIKTGISSTTEEFSLIIRSRSVPELIDFLLGTWMRYRIFSGRIEVEVFYYFITLVFCLFPSITFLNFFSIKPL